MEGVVRSLIRRDWRASHEFTEIQHVIVNDTKGELGRSKARNLGMIDADWYFFLDADDVVMPYATRFVKGQTVAVFGAVQINGRVPPINKWPCSTKEELFNMCIPSLSEDGFLSPGDVKRLLVVRAPHAYPIYRKDYAPNLQRLLNYVNRHEGVSTLGRSGEFMYMDVDKCMRRAFELSSRLSRKYGRVP